jgi:hypothetical protein
MYMPLAELVGKGALALGKATLKGLGGAAKVFGAVGAPIAAIKAVGVGVEQARRNQKYVAGLSEENKADWNRGRAIETFQSPGGLSNFMNQPPAAQEAVAKAAGMTVMDFQRAIVSPATGLKTQSKAMVNQYGAVKVRQRSFRDFQDAMTGLFLW